MSLTIVLKNSLKSIDKPEVIKKPYYLIFKHKNMSYMVNNYVML